MKMGNFFVKLISSLFILIFGLLCLTTTILLLIKNMTNQENITNYVKNANIFDYSPHDIMLDSNNSTLRQTIKSELLNMDIPSLIVDEVIDSEELDTILSNYVYNYTQYVLYNLNKPIFPSEDILNILKEKYSIQDGKELSEKQTKDVLTYIKLLGNKIDQSVFEKNEIDGLISINIVKKIVNIFNSGLMPLVLIIVMIAIIAIISACLGSIKLAINWCSKITVLNGILLIIASFVEVRVLIMYFNNQGLVDSLILSIVENGFQNMLVYGIGLIIIGLIFMIISAFLLKKEKKNPIADFNESKEEIKSIEKSKQDNEIIQKFTENAEESVQTIPTNEENKDNDIIEEKETKQTIKKPIKDSEILQKITEIQENKEENNLENNDLNKSNNEQVEDIDSSESEIKITAEEEKDESEEKNEQDNELNLKEEMEIMPVQEDSVEEYEDEIATEIEIEESTQDDEDKTEIEIETDDYSELKDEDKEPEKIEKQNINISPLEQIKINVIHPQKGQDVEFNPDENQEEDDDIEIL